MKSLFEQQGGTYRMVDGYRIPNLTLPDEPEYHIGIWGQRRLDYLKKHRKGFYAVLCTFGKLREHLAEIDQTANVRFWFITNQIAKAEGVTEQLKAENQLLWIQRMSNIHREELIYS